MNKSFKVLAAVMLLYIMVSSCGNTPEPKPSTCKYVVQLIDISPSGNWFKGVARDVFVLDTMYKPGDTVMYSRCNSCDYHYYEIIRKGGQ